MIFSRVSKLKLVNPLDNVHRRETWNSVRRVNSQPRRQHSCTQHRQIQWVWSRLMTQD